MRPNGVKELTARELWPSYYNDTGCSQCPSCLNCGLDKCIEDMSYKETRNLLKKGDN